MTDPVSSSAVSGTNGLHGVLRGGLRGLQRRKGDSFEDVGLGHSLLLGYSKEIESCSPPLPQAQDWGSPGGTRGPLGTRGAFVWRVAAKSREAVRVATVAGV